MSGIPGGDACKPEVKEWGGKGRADGAASAVALGVMGTESYSGFGGKRERNVKNTGELTESQGKWSNQDSEMMGSRAMLGTLMSHELRPTCLRMPLHPGFPSWQREGDSGWYGLVSYPSCRGKMGGRDPVTHSPPEPQGMG